MKRLTHYWGILLLVMLFFYRDVPNVLIAEMKCRLFVAGTFVALILFGIPYTRYVHPAISLIVFSFLGLWSIGSEAGFNQLLYMSCGLVLFLQALKFDESIIKKYLVWLGIAASASILLGYAHIDWYDLTSSRGTAYKSGAMYLQGKQSEEQRFFGLLGNTARSAMLPALLAPISGPIGIIIGLAACIKTAALGSVTPLAALLAGLAIRLRVFTLACVLTLGGVLLFKGRVIQEFNGSANERLETYTNVLSGVLDRPLLGHGLGYFNDASKRKHLVDRAPYWRQVHNDFLEGVFALGLLGFAPIVYVFGRALRNAKRELFGALISLSILALLWFPIHVIIVSQVAIIILAISQNKGEKQCDL